jgi:hypothetical protein
MDRVLLPMNLSPEKKEAVNLQMTKSLFFRTVQQALKLMPDEQFEAAMAMMDEIPEKLRKNFTGLLDYLPKSRGGRPPAFSLDIRRRAVQDIGHEYPSRDSLGEAIEVVARRYGMTPEYLCKVWRNRRRLREREV